MELVPHAGEHVRYGAFLPSVPVMRRVGDYVHCACRLVNALLGRLCGEGIPALKRDVEAFLNELTKPPGAAALPPAAATIDITAATRFLQDAKRHAQLVAIVQMHQARLLKLRGGRTIVLHGAVRIMLRALHMLFNLWRQKQCLSPAQEAEHANQVGFLREMWQAAGWRPTVWLHWVCARGQAWGSH